MRILSFFKLKILNCLFRPKLIETIVKYTAALRMVFLEFHHPLRHRRPPKPIHGLSLPELFTVKLVIFLKSK